MQIQPSTITSLKAKPRFANVSTTLMEKALMTMNPMQRLSGKFLNMKEGPNGNMIFQFVQDTSILWAPKAVVSRSFLELFESSFVEFIESGCFYFFAPMLVAPLLQKAFHKMIPKAVRPDLKMLRMPLSAIEKSAWKHVVPAKAGLAVASIAIATASQYALNFVKNIITERRFRKNEFSDIIGLTQGKIKHNKETHVMKKAKRRILECMTIATGVTVASLALAANAHRFPGFQKSLTQFAQWFDFPFKAVKDKATGKILKYKFDIGGNQLKTLMPFAIFSYYDAARDKLEKVEAGCRAFITGTYIAYWQPYIAAGWNRYAGKAYRHLGIFNDNKFNSVKNIETIEAECFAMAKDKLTKSSKGAFISKAAIEREALKLYQPRAAAKIKLFIVPYAFGILGIGLFTAGMNRVWTNYRFHVAERLKKQQCQKPLDVAQKNVCKLSSPTIAPVNT